MSKTNYPTVKLRVRSYEEGGFSYREISTRPPRDCTPDEIPIVDLGGVHGDFTERKELANRILHAAETSGFFYIKNHGVPEEVLQNAFEQTKEFFHLPLDVKNTVKARKEVSFYGYSGRNTKVIEVAGGDAKEAFNFHYEPRFDPLHKDHLDEVPDYVIDHIPRDPYIWNDVGLPHFQPALVAYLQSCLALGRQLIQIIASGLDLPEDYFDSVTSYPGGDCALNYYPGYGDAEYDEDEEVGLNEHTDLQILTLLWQSEHRGLQVLNAKNEWVFAPPIPGTFVVNIGDFLMRMTNDRLKSTLHRVIHKSREDRYSMPFFFGFNFNEKFGVVPTCISEDNPAKYEPVTCGELIAKRLKAGQSDY